MWLYLLRHGEAEDKFDKEDAARALTKEGREDVAAVALAVSPLLKRPARVLSSPYLRAEQSAEVFRETAGVEEKLVLTAALKPEGSWGALKAELDRLVDEGVDAVVAVGHNPSMSEMCGAIVGGSAEVRLQMKKGAIACFRVDELHGRTPGELHWMVTPRMVRSLGK
jgi:phosphohistidine phosphatase